MRRDATKEEGFVCDRPRRFHCLSCELGRPDRVLHKVPLSLSFSLFLGSERANRTAHFLVTICAGDSRKTSGRGSSVLCPRSFLASAFLDRCEIWETARPKMGGRNVSRNSTWEKQSFFIVFGILHSAKSSDQIAFSFKRFKRKSIVRWDCR